MSELDFSEPESEPINIKGLVSKYLRYWYLFVISVLLCLPGAYLSLRYVTPFYSFKITLFVKVNSQGLSLALII